MNLNKFPRYEEYSPSVPVYCLTPDMNGCFHRFFDTCPISPSGRYLAVLQMPYEDHSPLPGDAARIVVVDLETGEHKVVDETRGWEAQLGANINWGINDDILLYSDVDTATWQPCCVRLNWKTGERRTFGRGIYHVSPDGRQILCTNPAAMRRTQYGYGVIVPDEVAPRHMGMSDDDGLFITDAETGECRLLISIREAIERTVPKSQLAEYEKYENYFFHSKWNPQGDRLLFTLRRFPIDQPHRFSNLNHNTVLFDVFTMKPDGSELYNAVPADQWVKGGHHINWFPQGDKLSMNLGFKGDEVMRFTQVNYDGSDLDMIFEEPIGSGHPSFHPAMKYLVTDAYNSEPMSFDDGSIPIRLVNLKKRTEECIVRMRTQTPYRTQYPDLRVDPHPVWSRDFTKVIFNGYADGTRRIYLADLTEKV